jgi:hypothetical protein
VDDKKLQENAKDFFGTDIADFSYITDDLMKSDAALGPEAEVSSGSQAVAEVLYGNNARYGSRVINGTTYQVYYFEHGGTFTNSNDACGTTYTAWARQDVWHHKYLGKCPNQREKWSFSK